jgi:hypothetical protein
MSTGGGGGGGLKGYPPLVHFQKGTPPAKIFKADLVKILGKIANFGRKQQNFNDFSQKFELF